MSILQNGCQPWKKILDRGSHLRHSNDIDDRLEGAKNRAKHLWILFSKVLVKNDTKAAHKDLLVAHLHHYGDPLDQVSSLLAYACTPVVQPPLDDAAHLRNVGLRADAETIYD